MGAVFKNTLLLKTTNYMKFHNNISDVTTGYSESVALRSDGGSVPVRLRNCVNSYGINKTQQSRSWNTRKYI